MAPNTSTHHCTQHVRKIPDRCDKSSDHLPSTGSAQRVEEGAASELLPTSSYEKLRSSDISSPASDDHMPAVAAVASTECSRNCSARFLLQRTPAKSNHTLITSAFSHTNHASITKPCAAPKSHGFATMCYSWTLLQEVELTISPLTKHCFLILNCSNQGIAHYSPGTVPENRPPGLSRTTAPPS